MGTNYYIQPEEPCMCCGRPYESKHIGKSSWGWCFALRVYPNEFINTLEDWKKYWKGKVIVDEYDTICSEEEMLKVITAAREGFKHHEIDGERCIGNGEGTWDYFVNDFS